MLFAAFATHAQLSMSFIHPPDMPVSTISVKIFYRKSLSIMLILHCI